MFQRIQGGAIVTDDDDLAEATRLIRNFGFAGYDNVIHPGTNGKMTEICAAMGLTNLDNIDNVVETNRHNYYAYRDALADVPGVSLLTYNDTEHNNFQYIVVEVDEECAVSRDDIVAVLQTENVRARRYFWPGCHRMKPYDDLFPHADLVLSNTERVAERVLVLPTGFPTTTETPETIANILRIILSQSKTADSHV